VTAGLRIVAAAPEDTHEILRLVRALAEYEKLSQEVVATEPQLRETLFGPKPCAEVLLAREGPRTVGFALFFQNYSTFLARPGIYLEDLFVEPEYRGRGIGKALLASVAKVAMQRRSGRFEWAVLNWNQPAIDFYQSLGARPLQDWTVFRVTGDALKKLADSA
jgi:GNAT superfamily N-acetyltransferase